MKRFSELFKRYRLRAEFEHYDSFADELALKGYCYETSIFSHWQKGTRCPTNRHLVLKMIEIFIERGAIIYKEDADELMASTGLGYLTKEESRKLFKEPLSNPSIKGSILIPWE